jgi:hypothetical protein
MICDQWSNCPAGAIVLTVSLVVAALIVACCRLIASWRKRKP